MPNKKQIEFDDKIERQNKAIISFIWNAFISIAAAQNSASLRHLL